MRILITGMSITQGSADEEMGGWVNRMYVREIQKGKETKNDDGNTVFNLGIVGDCTSRLLKRFAVESKARLRNPEDIVIIDIGVNDTQRFIDTGEIKTPKEKFEKNLEELITQSKKHTENIVFLDIAPIVEERLQPMPFATDRSHYEKDVAEYREIIEQVCERHSCLHISMKGVFGDNPETILPDGIHPNAEGHKLIFERVKTMLKQEGLI